MQDTYSLLREFADSWVLLALTTFFLGAILFAWRPGSRSVHEDAGQVPFRHDDRPLTDMMPNRATDCGDGISDLIPEARA
ncbi:cbb3-type cytochrome c oxidase subunit 3 [Rubellimicrobium arenae]|uniref:cbb3-type cytochrome c oxidase subunit 3 n=1 Tax=Rubellimicrobium arenae TaxID=2817372 RepID=UPI001B305FCD